MMNLSAKEKKQIELWGLTITQVQTQIQNFIEGFPFLSVVRPATPEDGILVLSEEEVRNYVSLYQNKSKELVIVKFVPASGAASRMFKDLFEFLENEDNTLNKSVELFLINLKHFAFYETLKNHLAENKKSLSDAKDVIDGLLNGLKYGHLPKGSLQFHHYEDGARTPLDEHFVEGALYANGKNNIVKLHFTVSPEFLKLFEENSKKAQQTYKDKLNMDFHVDFSQQKKSTDTIAVDMDNKPFVDDDGSLLFRPAGHGALIENLNEIDADVIFIKNIDNVVPDRIKETTVLYKKALAGVLVDFQSKVFRYISQLSNPTKELVEEVTRFLEKDLNYKLPLTFTGLSLSEKADSIKQKLNRPIRVCGMVKNTGEPGGGPFWVQNNDGSTALQIAESVQLDPNDASAQKAMKQATHFNPVDLVCGVRDHTGKKFDLLKFTDPSTGFITNKSKSGRELKAQELPGLWNGAMADWITIFVDVPLITFNPVKTVNDLLRPEHQ